jgi:hypothetical protein
MVSSQVCLWAPKPKKITMVNYSEKRMNVRKVVGENFSGIPEKP